MNKQYPHPPIYTSSSTIPNRLKLTIDSIRDKISLERRAYVFFRADDVAVPSNRFDRLINLFTRYKVPLAMAVVPAWLTEPRWNYMKNLLKNNMDLWCLHQHGWRHMNYENGDKKQEFGSSRTKSHKIRDIVQGKQRLESFLGEDFYPLFTPPWNRCDKDTMHALKDLQYYGVSRMREKASKEDILPDYSVHVDLHTRKDSDSSKVTDNLLKELQYSLPRGLCGIMIHHQKMNNEAFGFLETLFQCLMDLNGLEIVNIKDLANNHMK